MSAPGFKVRAGQRRFERFCREHRVSGLLARRQYGKTTIASRIALFKMMKVAGHSVIFGSVKLDLGREIVRKEADAMQKAFGMMAGDAAATGTQMQLADAQGGKVLPKISADDFADLYEASRLEFRLYHSNSTYSRTKVVALTPDAVGETGDLILDEVGRVKNFRDVLEAVMPIIASNPEFRCIYTTTPPPDDTHPSFELLAPPLGIELPPNPEGNAYVSDLKIHVLRITAYDAALDGVLLYDDDTGKPVTPEESRARFSDKDVWDRNYGCKFVVGGTGACGLAQLDTAQRRGLEEKCAFFSVGNDQEFADALAWLTAHLGDGPVGGGWDLATTTKATSNPSSFSVMERRGVERILRAVINWKTADPDVAMERAGLIVGAVARRPKGGPMRRLCIDGTSERYFAQTARRVLGAQVPVELVVASETILVPGQQETINMKQYLGGMLVAELDDNHLILPPERYLREDWRLVKKEKGQFVCEPDADGKHGDTFDGAKLSNFALTSTGGAIMSTAGIRFGGNTPRAGAPAFQPGRLGA